MARLRRGTADDLQLIYRMQDVPYRWKVFAGPLPEYREFRAAAEELLESGDAHLFIFEKSGESAGFTQLVRSEESWDIIVWGRWLNTLIYAGLAAAFDGVHLPAVVSEVRRDNARIIRAYQLFSIRKIGQATVPCRLGKFDDFRITDFFYYEMTDEEYRERLPVLRKHSLAMTFCF